MFLFAVVLAACTSPGTDADDSAQPGTDATGPTSLPGSTTDTGGPPGSTQDCVDLSGLHVTDVTVQPGPMVTLMALDVILSDAASVAVVCTAVGDPTEEHLAESHEPSTMHQLRLAGLRTDTDYTCQVAPTCPTSTEAVATTQFHTEPAPRDFPQLDVSVNPALGMTGSWTLAGFRDGACSSSSSWVVAYDETGVARWWRQLPGGLWVDVEALYHPEDQTFIWGGGEGTAGRPQIESVWDGTLYSSDLPGFADISFHHDGKRLSDGRIISLEERDNSLGGDTWTGFGVRVHDPATGIVDLEIDSQRYVDEGHLEPGGGFFDADPYHANWVEVVDTPRGPELYVSLCFDQSIIGLDAHDGSFLWRLAPGEGWTVLDEAGGPLPESALPECQHGLESDGDTFLVYDNGQNRGYSQAIEWRVDSVTRTAQRLWQWSESDWWETTLGDIDDLGNDRVLITQAHPECWAVNRGDLSEIVEVDRITNTVASRMAFPDDQLTTYRAERYDGCEMFFTNTAFCTELADRRAELLEIMPE